ncbi:MAG: glucose-1-phosphate adenylyltransferase subunit GlgD [Clostridium sp.]|nr:glucose-1-phosphate adenylyltransferase subunit GlgD [Clostridium sp.]
MNDLHGILFAYRSDANLGELTRPRNTCSLPFGGRYRLIDFMLSSYVNAGISDIGVVVHESYQSLLDHLGSGKDWDLSRKHGGLRILPPFGYAERSAGEYRGNMEALSGVYDYLQNIRQDYVILAWGDMALNLPVEDVFRQHVDSGADITIVCTPILKGEPQSSGYVSLDETGRVCDLSLHHPGENALESLEVYILSKQLLLQLVEYCAAHNLHSFTNGVLQPRMGSLRIMPYIHQGYVARFQSVSSYYQHSIDLLNERVREDLFDPRNPIRTKDYSNPSTYYGPDSRSINSLVADGCFIEGHVENSIISRGVVVEAGANVSNCVLMMGTVVKAGASLSYVIADKNVTVNPDRMLMGHYNYPLAIAKGSVV